MQELLIEIFSEEIPARMQLQAGLDAKEIFTNLLNDHGASFKSVHTYVAPQRLVVHVEELAPTTATKTESRRGPKVGAPDAALQGFLKSTGLTQHDLAQENGYWVAHLDTVGQAIQAVMPVLLHGFLDAMPWPKSMRWYNPRTKAFTRPWVRPIRSILCVYAGNAVTFDVDGLNMTTGNTTKGHRFLAPETFSVTSFSDYKQKLENAYVILDHTERQKKIEEQLTAMCGEKGLVWQEDKGLLEEVAGLVDFPFVNIGNIEQTFMKLPTVVLSTSMKVHQKYFTLTTKTGAGAPYFAVATNVAVPSPTSHMMQGLEKVLRARLNDGLFFYDLDQKTPLESLVPKLDAVTYHQKLGSVGHKVKRLETLVPQFGLLRQAAHLCKADLLTQVVGEFPELQGIMGEIYAHEQGCENDVALALREYYLPQGPSDPCPTNPISWNLAFWDKLDTLVGFLGVGIKPTGSKDPFALRRAALGVLRLLVETGQKGHILNDSIQKVIAAYKNQNVILNATTEQDVIAFVQDRLAAYLKADAVAPEELQGVLKATSPAQFDVWSVAERAKALHTFLVTSEGASLKAAYKRASGILEKGEKGAINVSLLAEKAEKSLFDALRVLEKETDVLLADHQFTKVMNRLSALKQPIDTFFDEITVNCDNEDLRQNRYALLHMFVEQVNKIADFRCL